MTTHDVAVVGAGAAGLMTAIQAAELGLSVLLLDGREKVGAKIIMSGGTRCNLTNRTVTEGDFNTEQKHVLRAALRAFTQQDTLRFFESLGLRIELESSGKYFPATHSGQSVLDALITKSTALGVRRETPCRVDSVKFRDGRFAVAGKRFEFEAPAVVLTTGGLSFPSTGSDGGGYVIAESFGHTLVRTSPSLTPLLTNDEDWKSISGVALPAELSYWEGGRKLKACAGDMLFTHFGFSGPVVLDISRFWIRGKRSQGSMIRANFVPGCRVDAFRETLIAARTGEPRVSVRNYLKRAYPSRFVEVVLMKAGIDGACTLGHWKREDRERLIRELFGYALPVSGDFGYSKAEVTAGGVSLREISKSDFQSKLRPGLFMAGEILDVDGRIGGFNFQWAWSSGAAAARGVKRFLAP